MLATFIGFGYFSFIHLAYDLQDEPNETAWTIATDDPGVCQSVTRAGCVKMAKRIDVLLWENSWRLKKRII